MIVLELPRLLNAQQWQICYIKGYLQPRILPEERPCSTVAYVHSNDSPNSPTKTAKVIYMGNYALGKGEYQDIPGLLDTGLELILIPRDLNHMVLL